VPSRIRIAAAFLICLLAKAQPPLEYQVKAAFLLNFTKFIQWPAEAGGGDTPFGICVLGEDPFGMALDQIVEGETYQHRKITVQRVRRPVPSSCQVLFVNRSEKDVEMLLAGLGPGVLTVGEATDFLHIGGMINFVVENRRVRFDVNLGTAIRARLMISSKLLTVARTVENKSAAAL
jgi:hypothetical protein